MAVKRPAKKPSKAKALARPGDPLITPDGRTINPINIDGKKIQDAVSLIQISPENFKPSVRRSVRDMPASGDQLKAIACVVVCVIAGMTNRDISDLLGVETSVIDRVKHSAAYKDTFEILRGQFINANSDMVQARIAAYGVGAVDMLGNIAFFGQEEKNRLKASDSLLDRNEGAAKINPHQKSNASVLRIVVEDAVGNENGVRVELDGVNLGV